MLLPGDLDTESAPFLSCAPVEYDVAMAPHHGGKSSATEDLFAWSDPLLVIISGSNRVRNRAQEEALRAQGREVLHTFDDGAVTITIRPESTAGGKGALDVDAFRSRRRLTFGE